MSRIITYVRRQHIGLLALFIALGGTSYAAVTLPRNSVGSEQIRANAVGGSELKRNSVTSATVKNRSLTAADFKAGEIPAGAKGDTGAVGAQGAPGPQGAPGATGAQGEKGETGAAGAQGAKGEPGTNGTDGTNGLKGDPGEKGEPGEQGPAGEGAAETHTARLNLNASGSTFAVASGGGTAGTLVTWADSNVQYEEGGDFFDATRATANSVPGPAALVIPKTGTYILTAGARWAANDTGVRALAVNGPQTAGGVLASSLVNAATGIRTVQNVATSTRLAAGDRVYMSVGQNTGASLNLEGSQNQVHFSATYVGP